MSTGRTVDLTFKFTVEREDDEGWPWVATLQSVEPQDPVNCGRCSDAGYIPGKILCDACNAMESMDCCGPEEWLQRIGIKIKKKGTLVVNAYISWWYNDDDYDEKVHVNWLRWES